jgi:ribosome-associated protein
VEAIFDVEASRTLSDPQRQRLLTRAGPRIVAVAQDERSQSRNRELALRRLAERVALGLAVPRKRTATRPTNASRRERLERKRRNAERKRARRPPERGED